MAAGLLSLLIWLIIFVVVLYVVNLVINMIPGVPAPIKQVVLIVVGAVALILLLEKLMPLLGHIGLIIWPSEGGPHA